jgi:hypothetical protein
LMWVGRWTGSLAGSRRASGLPLRVLRHRWNAFTQPVARTLRWQAHRAREGPTMVREIIHPAVFQAAWFVAVLLAAGWAVMTPLLAWLVRGCGRRNGGNG